MSVALTFARVPEIHDEFTWRVYFSHSMTVGDVISTVCEQLGLAKSLPMTGGGAIDYAIEEVRNNNGLSILFSHLGSSNR